MFPYGLETHYSEVPIYIVMYCDVIKFQITSLLILIVYTRRKLIFKNRTIFRLAFSQNNGSNILLLPTKC